MIKIVAIAATLATISPAFAASKSFELRNLPFTCSTDSDCEFKTREFGCVEDADRNVFVCSDPRKFAKALRSWNRNNPNDTRD